MVTKKDILKFVEVFMTPVIQHRVLFIFSVLMSNVISWVALIKGVHIGAFLSFLLPIFDCYVFCLLAFLLGKLRLHFFIWLAVIALMFGELFTVCYCHSGFSLSIVRLIMETNANESYELARSVLCSWDLWQAILITSAVGVISYFLSEIKFSNEKVRYGLISLACVMVLWSSTRQIPAYVKLAKCYASKSISYCANENHFPQLYGPAVRFAYGWIWNVTAIGESSVLEKAVEQIPVDSCSFRCPLIVMIIGESYNRYHSQLYVKDYLPTTPFMMKRFESGNLIPFTDVVSKYNLTSEVFRSIFSTWDEDDMDEWTNHSLFSALFKKAGYDVYFFSNQFVVKSEDMWNVFGGTIFNTPNLSTAQFTSRNEDLYEYDGNLLRELPSTEQFTSRPALLIVHLMGQHVDYSQRYPESFNKFSPSSSRAAFGGKQGKKIAAEYDNATLYNDRVVEQVVSRFDSEDALCLYFADHGEEAFDWRDKYDRSQEEIITPEIAKYQYEIPMMFFLSDTFRANHPDIAKQVEESAGKPLISSDISNVLLYLGGIETKEYKSHRNILSPDYVPRRRLLRGTQDYDELMSGK